MTKPKIAIVGIGRWGKNLAREFNKVANIATFCHKANPETKDWLIKNYPKIPTKNYDNILKDKTIGSIIIATPIKTHHALAKKALLAGKNVFVEKPITNNTEQAKELVKLAKDKKRILFVGHIFSYHPVLTKLKRLNAVEPFKFAIFTWNKLGTFNEELIYNLLSHDVATSLELFGKSTGIKTLENHGMVTDSDVISVHLNFKNHHSCTIHINRVSNIKNKSVILSTNKSIYLWENNKLLKLNKTKNEFSLIFEAKATPLEIECAEFIKCIKKNPPAGGLPTDGEFGLKVLKILDKIKKNL